MKVFLLLATLAFYAAQSIDAKTFVCYYESWGAYRKAPYTASLDKIPTHLCTHVVYAFAVLNEQNWQVKIFDPNIDINQNGYRNAVALKQKNPNLKVTIAIGGWSDGAVKYSQMASNPDRRRIFAQSVANLVNTYGFDGADLDWEYPADPDRGGHHADKENFVALLSDMRNALGWNKLLTIATHSVASKVWNGYDVPRVSNLVNFIHVMTYDLRGAWDGRVGCHGTLYPGSYDQGAFREVTVGMRNWANFGAPKNKLIMGIGYYGKSFTLANPGNNRPGAPSVGVGQAGPVSQEGGTLFYFEICEKLRWQGWQRVFDQESKTPYAFLGNQWVGYEDTESIWHKIDFVNREGFGGAMAWAVDLDDPGNTCGQGPTPLSSTVSQFLRYSADSNDIPSEDNDSDLDRNPVTTCKAGERMLPHPTHCTRFVQCFGSKGYERKCPDGLIFDSNLKVCNWPMLVEKKVPVNCTDIPE